MSDPKTWRPQIDEDAEINPFTRGGVNKRALLDSAQLQDAEEDSAPLQGTKDLSDDDSLEDVIADDQR
jgi:hypothetical protein